VIAFGRRLAQHFHYFFVIRLVRTLF
jgi:hypothetical protein